MQDKLMKNADRFEASGDVRVAEMLRKLAGEVGAMTLGPRSRGSRRAASS